MNYIYYMNLAYELAKKAIEKQEIPIGCIIVYEDNIIGYGYNQRNQNKNSLHHAEIIAINMACEHMQDWRLEGCTLFVTVEPCAMCSGAILQSRIKTVVFGTVNKKAGCCGSIINILNEARFNHQTEIISGIMEFECSELMSGFFKSLRNKNT
jgi:tRNA(adenine34) deaminase